VTDDAETPECLACGTCCFSLLETYVPVSGDDHARLGDAADALVVFHGNRAFLRMEDGHCAALRVDAAAGAFVCTVYDRRPDTCRALARGSRECAGERATKHDRPIAALARARRPA
jgi:uncharacterized protein